ISGGIFRRPGQLVLDQFVPCTPSWERPGYQPPRVALHSRENTQERSKPIDQTRRSSELAETDASEGNDVVRQADGATSGVKYYYQPQAGHAHGLSQDRCKLL